jgi:hypothetical protein
MRSAKVRNTTIVQRIDAERISPRRGTDDTDVLSYDVADYDSGAKLTAKEPERERAPRHIARG